MLGVQQAVVGSSSDIKKISASSQLKSSQQAAASILKAATQSKSEAKKTVVQTPPKSWGASSQPSNSITPSTKHSLPQELPSVARPREASEAAPSVYVTTQHSYSKPAALSPNKPIISQGVRKADDTAHSVARLATAVVSKVSRQSVNTLHHAPKGTAQSQRLTTTQRTPPNTSQTLVTQRRPDPAKQTSLQSTLPASPSLSKSYHVSAFQTSPQSASSHSVSRTVSTSPHLAHKSPTTSPSQAYAGLSLSQIQAQMVAQSRNLGYSQQAHGAVSQIVQPTSPADVKSSIWRTADLGSQKGQSAFAVPKATSSPSQHHQSAASYAGLSLSDLSKATSALGHNLHSPIPQSPDRIPGKTLSQPSTACHLPLLSASISLSMLYLLLAYVNYQPLYRASFPPCLLSFQQALCLEELLPR